MNAKTEPHELISKITALAAINHEIIDSIESTFDSEEWIVHSFMYRLRDNQNDKERFTVEEIVHKATSKEIVKNWQPLSNSAPLKVTTEMKLDNNMDYNIYSFEDLKRLNTQILDMVLKLEKNSIGTIDTVRSCLWNLEIIQVHLGDVQEILIGLESQLPRLQTLANAINTQYNQEDHHKLLQQIEKASNHPIQNPVFTKTVTLNENSYHRLSEHDDSKITPLKFTNGACSPSEITCRESFDSGFHRWSIIFLPLYRDRSWLLLGVRPSSEKSMYGVLVKPSASSASVRIESSFVVDANGRIDVELDCDSKVLTIAYGNQWEQSVNLPSSGPWWPHFKSADVSFNITAPPTKTNRKI